MGFVSLRIIFFFEIEIELTEERNIYGIFWMNNQSEAALGLRFLRFFPRCTRNRMVSDYE